MFVHGFTDEIIKLSSLEKWEEHFKAKSARKKLKWDDWKTRILAGASGGALLAAILGRKGDWFSRPAKGALGGGVIGAVAPTVGRNISSSRAMERIEKLKKEGSLGSKDLSEIVSKGKKEEAGITGATGGALGALLGLSLGNKKLRSALIGAGLGGLGAVGAQQYGRNIAEKRHGKDARGLTWKERGRFDKVSAFLSEDEKEFAKFYAAAGAAGGLLAPRPYRLLKSRAGSAALEAAVFPVAGTIIDRIIGKKE